MVAGYLSNLQDNLEYIIIATLSFFMGKRLAKKLVKQFVSYCADKHIKAVHLYTKQQHIAAIHLYKK